jgi:hypothetical protein
LIDAGAQAVTFPIIYRTLHFGSRNPPRIRSCLVAGRKPWLLPLRSTRKQTASRYQSTTAARLSGWSWLGLPSHLASLNLTV